MKRRLALLLCVVFCLFSGCSVEADELLALPQLPAQHVLVQNQINQLLADGVSLSAPLSGTDRSSVQMVDLDQDGVDEAVVFGVSRKNDTTVPQVYIYRFIRGRYELAQRLDGVGDSIDTVQYPRMGPQRHRLLIVGWRLGANPVCGLSVYQYDGQNAVMLLSSEYTGLCAADFDGDKTEELLVLRYSATEVGNASLYTYSEGAFASAASAPLTAGVTTPSAIVFEPVGGGYSGAVVDAPLLSRDRADGGMVTDVLICTDGRLSNVTYSEADQRSVSTYRPIAYPSRDINGDGILEIPRIEYLPNVPAENGFMRVDWCSIGESGTLERQFSAFTVQDCGWYFIMPDTLIPSVTLMTGEHEPERISYVFCEYNSETEQVGRPFWEIFTITGLERNSAVAELNLFELARTSTRIYAAKLHVSDDSGIITYSELSRSFFLN